MATTTPSGRTRVPTMGDEPDIPADMMKMAFDLEVLSDAGHPNQWVKRGRVDGNILSGINMIRIPSAACFFSGTVPACIIMQGIDQRFYPAWDGSSDGSGALVKVFDLAGTQYTSGASVAFYWAAFR